MNKNSSKVGWSIEEFDFDLPSQSIALRPARPRDSARLLVVDEHRSDRHIGDLPTLLTPGDVLVFNDTRVIAAQLTGQSGGRSVQVTLHKTLSIGGELVWTAFARPGKRARPGQDILFPGGMVAHVKDKRPDGEVVLHFACEGEKFDAWLSAHGAMPLPPYISAQRVPDDQDRIDYQTVFARTPGAVAAPTAGLHFTQRLLTHLHAAGIATTHITLTVGAGTFQPVRASNIADHAMHSEWGCIGQEAATAINAARAHGKQVIAVGTTCLRLLETAATSEGHLYPWQGKTSLFIAPGYTFRCVDRLLTNFHLPRSTLFILVCAFSGVKHMQESYAHALESGYRFYSYGDACLLSRPGI